jgi:hypothetical protein
MLVEVGLPCQIQHARLRLCRDVLGARHGEEKRRERHEERGELHDEVNRCRWGGGRREAGGGEGVVVVQGKEGGGGGDGAKTPVRSATTT